MFTIANFTADTASTTSSSEHEVSWRADDAVSVPFETTILDGIDMRETARHIHEGRIYVKEFKRVKGGVGSIVIIFDEGRTDEKYPYLMTWLGEHDQESDMAFYATDPAEHIVGPGISRCTYGGAVMTYPPLRLADVWGDPEYDWARTKAERLLPVLRCHAVAVDGQ